MEPILPFIFAGAVGFGHAFEADHLVAVGNIVTKRDRLKLAIKDGIFWGLGHTSTIVLIGAIMIIGKATFLNGYFGYFEAGVGLMLVVLGCYRLVQYFRNSKNTKSPGHKKHHHHMAYGIGFIHGLAGSGTMILLVMAEMNNGFNGMLYLLIFGIGSVIGMLIAAGIFSLPFSKKLNNNHKMQLGLVIFSSILCIGYGGYIMVENLG
ncbi:MAG: sulfite exporter TauE/SafE family protein [Bacteroidota bacterium]